MNTYEVLQGTTCISSEYDRDIAIKKAVEWFEQDYANDGLIGTFFEDVVVVTQTDDDEIKEELELAIIIEDDGSSAMASELSCPRATGRV